MGELRRSEASAVVCYRASNPLHPAQTHLAGSGMDRRGGCVAPNTATGAARGRSASSGRKRASTSDGDLGRCGEDGEERSVPVSAPIHSPCAVCEPNGERQTACGAHAGRKRCVQKLELVVPDAPARVPRREALCGEYAVIYKRSTSRLASRSTRMRGAGWATAGLDN